MSLKEKAHDLLARIASKNPKGRRYDEKGVFYPDPTPIAPPVGYVRSPTIAEQIRTMVRSEQLRAVADASGMDTFEEADDFDIGDDYDPRSPWEEQFEGEFLVPVTNQEPVARDPDDRNPPTPPNPTSGATEGGSAGGSQNTPPAPPAAPRPSESPPKG